MQKEVFVSLGSSCSVAWQLQKNNRRKWAYPFDWVRSDDLDMITNTLTNNFVNFIDSSKKISESIKFPISDSEDFPEVNNVQNQSIIMKNQYGIKFYHDFSNESDIDQVDQKYKRRIERLIELINGDQKIYFIRDEIKPSKISCDKINRFIKIIKDINPDCKFKLIIIVHNPDNKDLEIFKFKMENTEIINDKEKFDDWKRPNFDWNGLFTVS